MTQPAALPFFCGVRRLFNAAPALLGALRANLSSAMRNTGFVGAPFARHNRTKQPVAASSHLISRTATAPLPRPSCNLIRDKDVQALPHSDKQALPPVRPSSASRGDAALSRARSRPRQRHAGDASAIAGPRSVPDARPDLSALPLRLLARPTDASPAKPPAQAKSPPPRFDPWANQARPAATPELGRSLPQRPANYARAAESRAATISLPGEGSKRSSAKSATCACARPGSTSADPASAEPVR